jgi:porin
LHGIASHGGKPNANHVGSSQGIDNIEVDTNTAKIFQAWVQKQWLDDKLSVLLGLYDLNSEFYVSHSTGIFLHPAPGIGSELAQTGLNGPSVFPTSSMGLRVAYHPTPEVYMQAVVLDGVPGDPNNPRGTHIQFNDGDGTLRVAELGYIPIKEGNELLQTDKYAVGAWSYTTRFEDLVEVDGAGDPLLRNGNSGFYVLAEKNLYQGTRNPVSHVDGFIRYGRAKDDFNQFSDYFQTGLVFNGMVSGRDEDQFALSFVTARTGDKYRLAAFNNGQQVTRHESVWEVTYRAQLMSWLVAQPNIQYVINPDTNAQIKNATVLGIRFELSAEK